MAFVQASPFTFRDFLQSILPGLIAASLFAPYSGAKSTEEVLIGVALLSYVAYTPLTRAAQIFNIVPFLRNKIADIKEEMKWAAANWNYDRLFYSASNEDREYLYLTGAYVQFYRLSALYFLLYFLVQIGALLKAMNPILVDLTYDQMFDRVFAAVTPVLGEWKIPTVAAALLAFIILWYLIADFLNETRILFFRQYEEMARKYHRQDGGIARSIWGSVLEEGVPAKPVSGATVILENERGEPMQVQQTDSKGRFQFRDCYELCADKKCKLRAKAGASFTNQDLPVGPKWAPPIDIYLPAAQPPRLAPESSPPLEVGTSTSKPKDANGSKAYKEVETRVSS